MDVKEVLEKALEELQVRGHTKHTFMDDEGRVCALGAIRVALNTSDDVLLYTATVEALESEVIFTFYF